MSFKWVAWTNVFLCFFMSILLSILITVGLGQHISIEGFLYTFVWAIITSLVIAFSVPLSRMGAWWCRQMGADLINNKSGMPYLISSGIQTGIFLILVNAVLTFALTGLETIDGMTYFDRWWSMNLNFYIVALVAYLFVCPLSTACATKITGIKGPGVIELEAN